jgi:hypothetical protein
MLLMPLMRPTPGFWMAAHRRGPYLNKGALGRDAEDSSLRSE